MLNKQVNENLTVTGHELRGEGDNELVVITVEEFVETNAGAIKLYQGTLPFNGPSSKTNDELLAIAKKMYKVGSSPFSGGILSVPVDLYKFENEDRKYGPRYLPANVYNSVQQGDFSLYFSTFASRFDNGRCPDWWETADDDGPATTDFDEDEVPVKKTAE